MVGDLDRDFMFDEEEASDFELEEVEIIPPTSEDYLFKNQTRTKKEEKTINRGLTSGALGLATGTVLFMK